ncbi:CHAT domain-containing protein [Azotobacter chroococcum]|uniref:CHAT domain-containing protein n=1 Tax=Azotobacter chroococcum TaxID=353 RepID=UPI0010ADD2F9|nr:CHAT domain-containing protein [Azotobacter chroococcum]TKD47270.1 CHAT domain-containing protein [Azotobacter chroococcum]
MFTEQIGLKRAFGGIACLGLALLACGATAVRANEIAPSIALGGAHLKDADTLLGLTSEGMLLYQSDPVKLSGYQYCSQAIALAEGGELRLSVRAAGKALHLGRENQDPNLQAMAARDLAIAFSYAGQLDKAELFANEALRYQGESPEKVLGPAYKTLGDVAARRGEHQVAVRHYKTALANASPRYAPLIQASLTNAMIDAGELPRARQILDNLHLPDDVALVPLLQRIRARLLLAEQRPREAAALYRQVLASPQGSDSRYEQVWAWDGLARSEAALGNADAVADALRQALDGLDQVRARFRSEEFKMGLFSDVQQIFEHAVDFHSARGDEVEAFEISERSRARSLLDAVRERARLPGGLTDSVGISQLQASLSADERVVQFHALPKRLLVWVVGPDRLQQQNLNIQAADLAGLVEAFRDAVANGRKNVEPVAAQLGEALLGKLGLEPGQRLIIVPHGPLHYLPFQALRLRDRWLIEEHPLALVPSLGVALGLIQDDRKIIPRLTAFGNPQVGAEYELPGAEREVVALGRLFPERRLFVGSAATKTAFRTSASSSPLLHLAAHAQADRLDPLHSRILLANEEGRQSFLEVRELSDMQLSGLSLVTLSACESGLGRVERGDEVQGFPRAFLAAGASAMIASLWEVPDEPTERLMTTLYGELARGVDLQRAMQAGQLAVLRHEGTRNPYFWAPFSLIGDWRLTVGN